MLLLLPVQADDRVIVVAHADEAYTQRKFAGDQPQRETFIFMQGRYYSGSRVDRSIETMSFRQILGYLVPKLADRAYVPAKSIPEADLMLVVHWGVTDPRVAFLEMPSITAPISDSATVVENIGLDDPAGNLLGSQDRFSDLERLGESISNEHSSRDLAQLLGYAGALRNMQRRPTMSLEEETLRFDLRTERYFIIVQAYELRTSAIVKSRRPVWSLHMNVSSPGNNFRTAMSRISVAAPQFFGRTSRDVETVRSKPSGFKVELGELIILGEVK